MAETEDGGYLIEKKKRKRETNDCNPEQFWAVMADVHSICKFRFKQNNLGAKKIKEELSLTMGETTIRKYMAGYIYDEETDGLYYRSTKVGEPHRKVLGKDEMIEQIEKNHKTDHRKSDAIYETLRKSFFPVVRENTRLLFTQYVKCTQCLSAVDLPKTQRTRKPIPATYPNSRWQMDLKKMPPCRGYNYICNVVDCHSRFAFGGYLKQKTSKEVADTIIKFIYLFGPPRILQTDNGKEFNNSDLSAVMDEFKTRHINGRPYHPQSQGRVERFNRTVVAYFRTKFVDTRDWPSLLGEFYYQYNNRVNKSTRPMTPHQRFFKRPNFSMIVEEQVPLCNLTREEKEFLNTAHLDVEEEEKDENTLETMEIHVDKENTPSSKIRIETETENSSDSGQSSLIQQTQHIVVTTQEETRNISEGTISKSFEANGMTLQEHHHDRTLSSCEQVIHRPFNDITNSQSMRAYESFRQHSDVSPYYQNLYAKRFLQPTEPTSTPCKRRYSDSDVFMIENREQWDGTMYPMELFPPKPSVCTAMTNFNPAVGDFVDFKPNSALSAGTNVFLSEYWRKGLVIDIQMDDSKGRVFTVEDCLNKKVHQLSKYLIRPNML